MKHHDAETKAACMSALLQGAGVTEVAGRYKLPMSTVSRWKSEAWREAGRSEDVGALLLTYLTTALQTLSAQAAFFGDPDWLRKQSAGELAVLHGVQCDKAIRLLEALESAPVGPGYDA